MLFRLVLLIAMLAPFAAKPSLAQSHDLRGLTESSPNRLPSARQQLDQSLQRRQLDLSTRQLNDGRKRLNRTDDINRANTRPETTAPPCPGANESCRD